MYECEIPVLAMSTAVEV